MKDKLDFELASEDCCPKCLGELDTGFECNNCGFDCFPIIFNPNMLPELTEKEREAMNKFDINDVLGNE